MTIGNGIVIGALLLAATSSFVMLELHQDRQRCIEMWRAAYTIGGAEIIWAEAGLSGSGIPSEAGTMADAVQTVFGTTFEECRQ